MPINIDAAAMEARYSKTTGAAAIPTPMQDLYAPGVRPERSPGVQGGTIPATMQGQIPVGIPIPEGTIIRQNVGRGQPAMQVVPPQAQQSNQPAMAMIPPQPTNRTTIGTFVEPNKTNPMTSSPPPVNSGLVEAPVGVEALNQPIQKKEPKRKLDLVQEILTHIWELGGEKGEECQKFYDRSEATIKNWQQQPAKIPMDAIQKFLNKRPGVQVQILEQLESHFSYNGDGGVMSLPNRGKMDVMVCSPVLQFPTLPWCAFLTHLAKTYELGYAWQADTRVERSRNMLADRFIKSGCTWSLWVDADMAAPIGNGDYFKWLTNAAAIPDEYTQYDALKRLMGHGKAIVGGVYASRKYHGSLVIQPEINPRSHEDKLLCNEIRRGTARGLAGVEWIGFGIALVHREVFLEVQRRFPNLAPQSEKAPWRYFHVEHDEGEDEAFCQRARACSIPIWLDTQLICGHIGPMAFLPEHTQPVMAL